MCDLLVMRVLLPWMAGVGLLTMAAADGPLSAPMLLTDFYWIYTGCVLVKALIARDIGSTPQPVQFWLLLVFPFYRLALRVVMMTAQLAELLRIGAKHPYVPDHIWQETPWW